MAKKAIVPDRETLTRHIVENLRKAENRANNLRKTNTRLVITSIVSSAATTLVTAFAAATSGPLVGEGTGGWQLTCIIAAIFGFITTVCIGLSQQLQIGERLAAANECAGKLKSLDVAIVTASREWSEIADEFEEIVRSYPELLR